MKRLLKSIRIIYVAAALTVACSDHEVGDGYRPGDIGVAVPPVSMAGNTTASAGPTAAVSGGPNTLGVVIPSSAGVIARIQNGLEGNAIAGQGNFADGIAQTSTNLPKVTNVMNASGFDQVELLAYAACADLTTNSPPLMQSVYNVDPNATIAANQAALVAAGMRMLDQHTAGLASQGPAAAQLNTILTTLVTTEAGVASNTSKIAFMTVCIAVNTAGATMLGL
jgi:hypothetical protein